MIGSTQAAGTGSATSEQMWAFARSLRTDERLSLKKEGVQEKAAKAGGEGTIAQAIRARQRLWAWHIASGRLRARQAAEGRGSPEDIGGDARQKKRGCSGDNGSGTHQSRGSKRRKTKENQKNIK